MNKPDHSGTPQQDTNTWEYMGLYNRSNTVFFPRLEVGLFKKSKKIDITRRFTGFKRY